MNLILEFFIAIRYLRSKHKSGFISITSSFATIGIILGVATLIVVMSVMNGYREELVRITLGVGGHITIKGGREGIIEYPTLQEKIKTIPDIVEITPMIEGQAMVVSKHKSSGSLIRGIEVLDLARRSIIANNIIDGEFQYFADDEDSIIIGETLANNLYLNVGDEAKIVTSSMNKTVIGSIPKFKSFKVAGIFRSGSYIYDNALIYMHMNPARKLFNLTIDKISQLEVNIKDPLLSEEYTNKISELIKRRYYIEDWKYQNSQILSALDIERTVMFLILTLIIIVAAFNIISSLYMLINDKKYDIAILRTLGISRYAIVRIFILMGLSLGLFGTVTGVILGVGFAQNIESIRTFLESITSTDLFNPVIYYLNTLPAKIEVSDVKRIAFTTIFLSVAATIFPAMKAASVTPAEALRNE